MSEYDADASKFVETVAKRYLAGMAACDDAAPEEELLQALGPLEVGSVGHRRAFGLGLSVVRRPLARWGAPKVGPADDIARSLQVARACLSGGSGLSSLQIDQACRLDSGFIDSTPGSEEGQYAGAMYGAVAALCRFALYAGVPDGVDALVWGRLADGEEYERSPREMRYKAWLTAVALPAAYQEQPLSQGELNPGWTGSGVSKPQAGASQVGAAPDLGDDAGRSTRETHR